MSDSTQNGMTVAAQTPGVGPRTADGRAIETERVDGGVLVFARVEKGVRELIGTADVESASALRQSLAERGFGRGAVHTLETYEPSEVGL